MERSLFVSLRTRNGEPQGTINHDTFPNKSLTGYCVLPLLTIVTGYTNYLFLTLNTLGSAETDQAIMLTLNCPMSVLDLLDRIQDRAIKLIGNGQVNNTVIENVYAIES